VNLNHLFDLNKIKELFHAKSTHGQLFLFKSKNLVSVFRPLTMDESKLLMELGPKLNEVVVDDLICYLTYVVSNKDIDYILNYSPCGLVKKIADQIAKRSIIQEEKEFKKAILESRSSSSTSQNIIESIISKAYPIIGADVKKLTQNKQLELLGKSEKITNEMLDLGDKNQARNALKSLRNGMTVIGGDITSPEVADKPDFNGTERIP